MSLVTLATILKLLGSHASQYSEDVSRSALKFRLDPLLIAAVIEKESGFSNYACKTGSHGLMQVQLKPRDCQRTLLDALSQGLYVPRINIERGAKLMWWWRRWWRKHHRHKGYHWLLHYNQGFGKCPPDKPRCSLAEREPIQTGAIGGYAKRVLSIYKRLKRHEQRRSSALAL